MRTITVKKGTGEGSKYTIGWHTLTISKARYGDYNGTKLLDVWFKDYPDNFNARIYAKMGKDGEEFSIGRVFRFANAGITEALDGPDGTVVLKVDDTPEQLVDKEVNVFLYKDGDYSRALNQFAPTAFEGKADTFTDDDVEYWKQRSEKYYNDYVKDKVSGSTTKTSTEEAEAIFG